MRALGLATILGLLASASAGAGWSAKVDDSSGFRVAGLFGTVTDDETNGIAIYCDSTGAQTPAIMAAVSPAPSFANRPGEHATIVAGDTRLDAVIRRSDSTRLEIWGDVEDLPGLLGQIGDGISLRGDRLDIAIAIPSDGFSEARAAFEIACGVKDIN